MKDNAVECINKGSDEQMEIHGYKRSTCKTVVVWIFIILTVGILRLIFYWKPDWFLKSTFNKCCLKDADKVMLKDKYDQIFVETVKVLKNYRNEIPYSQLFSARNGNYLTCQEKEITELTYFINKRWKYIWNEENQMFFKLKGDEENISIELFHRIRGLSGEEQQNKRFLFGENSIRIDLTPLYKLLFREVFSPFYMFQIVSCILWYADDYYYYASCIILLSILSTVISLYSIRKNERALRDMIAKANEVTVFRFDSKSGQLREEKIRSENLVPGDIISIENSTLMQCDAILLNGNVIVNESMLTGESVPETKIAVANTNSKNVDSGLNKVNEKEHSKHLLFGGTQVIQTRSFGDEKVKAVVYKTGFNTTKGVLIRSILYPKPVDFQFNNDTYKYVAGLGILALCGMIAAIVMKVLFKNPVEDIIQRSLDIITIAVPPALPGALTAGLVYAQIRLKKKKIYCISPRTINICGTINTIVFDKTGTLTEDGLDMKCILPARSNVNQGSNFGSELDNIKKFNEEDKVFLEAMATCHSISKVNGLLIGDPLDCKMFEFTNWELIEPMPEQTKEFNMFVPTIVFPKASTVKSNPQQLGIVRQFPFSSSLQRMSVIVRSLNHPNFDIFCKGSPEKIAELSKPESLPQDFQRILSSYTKEGYRVIAIARKSLRVSNVEVLKIERENIEIDLQFLGLIVLENRLKPETWPTIQTLKSANIRTIMCTGDNILTGLSVARDCAMISEKQKIILVEAEPGEQPKFSYADIAKQMKDNQKPKEIQYEHHDEDSSKYLFAVTGKTFGVIRNEHKDLFNRIVVRGAVFGRMSPDQKQQLVETLQTLGYFVAMCGDGANDCGALKAANAGISLSEAEASVASPFTSKTQNISCVPTVISEGRCALITSFGIVKFIVMYSITQFASVLILYGVNAGLTDFEFLYVDLILMTLNAFLFSRTEAYPKLHHVPPFSKLIAFRPIFSLLFHTLLIFGVQVFVFFYVKMQPWFEYYEDSTDKSVKSFASYENTAIFTVSMFQYLGQAVIFSKGAPYRLTIFSNYLFMLSLTLTLAFSLILALGSIEFLPLLDFFTIRLIPDLKFRAILVGIPILHFFVAYIFECFIIERDSLSSSKKKNSEKQTTTKCCKKKFKNLFNKIEHEMTEANDWPKITSNSSDLYSVPRINGINNPNFSDVIYNQNETTRL